MPGTVEAMARARIPEPIKNYMKTTEGDSFKSESSDHNPLICIDNINELIKERDFLAEELERTQKELRFYKERCKRLQEALESRRQSFRLSTDTQDSADYKALQQTKAFIASVISKGYKQTSPQYSSTEASYSYSDYDSFDSDAENKGTANVKISTSNTKLEDLAGYSGIGLSQGRETLLGLKPPISLYNDHLEVAYDTIAVLLNTIHALQPTPHQVERITNAFIRRGIIPVFLDSSKTTFSLNIDASTSNSVQIYPRFAEGSFIPQQAYCLMAQFVARYLIPKEEANELLIALCALMKRIDDEECAVLTSRLRSEITNLRRRLSMATPYEKVLSDNKIMRLKQDLQHFRTLYMREIDRKTRKVNVNFHTSSDSSLLQAMNTELRQLTATLSSTMTKTGTTGEEANTLKSTQVVTTKAPSSKARKHRSSHGSPERSFMEQPPVTITSVEVARTMTHEFEILTKRIRNLLGKLLAATRHCEDPALFRNQLLNFAATIETLLIEWSASSRQILSAILQLTHDAFTSL